MAAKKIKKIKAKTETYEPKMISIAAQGNSSSTLTRSNSASYINRIDRYANIDAGIVPYRYSSSVYGSPDRSLIDVRDAVVLCQKCYYNFAIFRNVIDLMTEFSTSNIILKGGSQQSRDFFGALFNRINLWELQDKYYREYYRSGNVFIYRFDTDVQPGDIKKLTQVFGEEGFGTDNYFAPTLVKIRPDKLQIEPMKMPARYIILNPADIQMMSTLNFAYGLYFKIMTDYEIARLRNPTTEQDVETFKDLPKEVQAQIKTGSRVISIPLDPTRISMVFYKKQDYEPFSVPMGFPVLEDINAKAEMKKIDLAIARTMQQMVLLVTAGAKPEEGGVNAANLNAIQRLFANDSVGRVLVADYTTKAQFVIPDIGELLNPEKYEILNQDINIGLNNVFAGAEKFANQQQKVELFVARLESGRQAFLNNFLQPEIKRIAKSLGFKNYPTAECEKIELKDNSVVQKLFARLIEIGVLTPKEGLKAIDKGVLPDETLMEDEQREYKSLRDKGMYVPLIGAPKDKGSSGQNGRPKGTGTPQLTKKITPIGKSRAAQYSLSKLGQNMILAQDLNSLITKQLKKKHKIKSLNDTQKEVASIISRQIIANEKPEKWLSEVEKYCEKPETRISEQSKEINDIAAEHGLDDYLGALLYHSKLDAPTS